MNDDRDAISKNGWCQGSSLAHREDMADFLVPISGKIKSHGKAVFLVISQDCDILAPSQDEPYVECLVLRKINSNKTNAKLKSWRNPRKIQVELSGQNYECSAKEVVFLKKEYLISNISLFDLSPNMNGISEEIVDIVEKLKHWKANRYIRTGLPEAFAALTRPVLEDSDVYAFLSFYNEEIKDVLIELRPFEESDNYQCGVILAMDSNVTGAILDEVSESFEGLILDRLREIAGIRILNDTDDYEEKAFDNLMLHRDVTLEMLDRFKRYYYDPISLDSNDG